MTANRYSGICYHCGMEVPAGTGDLKNINGRWIVYHAGPCPEITSGLGIGGIGSDDYSIHAEPIIIQTMIRNNNKNGGGQLWEPCPRCHQEPVHLDCGYCNEHCRC